MTLLINLSFPHPTVSKHSSFSFFFLLCFGNYLPLLVINQLPALFSFFFDVVFRQLNTSGLYLAMQAAIERKPTDIEW